MKSKLIKFPETQVCSRLDAHSLVRGGMNMEVKHTHPEYEDPAQREERLRDIRRCCIAAISALRDGEGKHSA